MGKGVGLGSKGVSVIFPQSPALPAREASAHGDAYMVYTHVGGLRVQVS